MLSKFLSEGNKLELKSLDRRKKNQEEDQQKIYHSEIYNIISDDTMEICMPIEKTKLVLLPVDGKFELVAYGLTGLYRCEVRIIDRYKSNNVYLLLVEMTAELSKHQRREYYRYSCLLDMRVRTMGEEELAEMEADSFFDPDPEIPMEDGVIIDISGGGLRFVSQQKYEVESLVYCTYNLNIEGRKVPFEVLGKVLAVNQIKNRAENFEHRISYYKIDVRSREKIIKFIFEEERKERKKENSV